MTATGGGFYRPKYSDFYTYHSYGNGEHPLPNADGGPEHLCTEALNRPYAGVVDCLRDLAGKENGFVVWELMIGRDNCRFPWGHPDGLHEPAAPFHGVIYPDGHPWELREIEALLGEAAFASLASKLFQVRTQITIFADAQLMPCREARLEHMRRILEQVLPGREHKIIMLEVANEAWQNGFPGNEGVAELRAFATYLNDRTEVPVAITSNHDWPTLGSPVAFDQVYADSSADVATWHFSRDRRTDAGWKPVYDCWDFGDREGFPPVSSNEPIGPGASVNSESEPIRLVMAAAFAYAAKLPMYVFHSEAGVFGKTRFEETPVIDRFRHVLRLLPADLPSWERHDGKQPEAPLTVFAGGQPSQYWPEVESAEDGCVRNPGSRQADRFVCVPIGIRSGGLQVEARQALRFDAHDPLTGEKLISATMQPGERLRLPAGPGALIVRGQILLSAESEK